MKKAMVTTGVVLALAALGLGIRQLRRKAIAQIMRA